MTKLLWSLTGLLLLSACDNTLDLIDDYRETPVVYGLLNEKDTVHFVRVQKAYLGEGNAYLMGQNSDSIYYDTADIRLYLDEFKNGLFQKTYSFQPRFDIVKQEGVFVDKPHIVYALSGLKLNASQRYTLRFENLSSGLKTEGDMQPVAAPVQLTLGAAFNVNIAGDDPFRVKYYSSKNGKMYGLTVRFKYLERPTGSLVYTTRSVDFKLSDQLSINTLGNQLMEFLLNGKEFYAFLGNTIPVNPALERPATACRLDFIFRVGSEEFYTYYVVGQPSNAVFSVPEYTNLSPPGKGIFTSRYSGTWSDYPLSSASIDTLRYGQYTADRFQ